MAFKIKTGGGSKRGPSTHRFGQVRMQTGKSFGKNIGKFKIRFPRKVG